MTWCYTSWSDVSTASAWDEGYSRQTSSPLRRPYGSAEPWKQPPLIYNCGQARKKRKLLLSLRERQWRRNRSTNLRSGSHRKEPVASVGNSMKGQNVRHTGKPILSARNSTTMPVAGSQKKKHRWWMQTQTEIQYCTLKLRRSKEAAGKGQGKDKQASQGTDLPARYCDIL